MKAKLTESLSGRNQRERIFAFTGLLAVCVSALTGAITGWSWGQTGPGTDFGVQTDYPIFQPFLPAITVFVISMYMVMGVCLILFVTFRIADKNKGQKAEPPPRT
jgi:hypothetical protein